VVSLLDFVDVFGLQILEIDLLASLDLHSVEPEPDGGVVVSERALYQAERDHVSVVTHSLVFTGVYASDGLVEEGGAEVFVLV